ncbi:MAG: PTS sugar transporter subunit IIA [Alkalibacterium sp.]|nr:PTS sugar transporter subunit IIA [Alkalibacterium sp.]
MRIALTPLEADNYITEKYCSEVTEAFRKNGAYMFIGEGIALPHARSNHVMQTGFSVLQLKKPVKYTDELSIKLLICFSSEDNMNHLETLISLVDHIKSASFTESLKTVNTADELADQLLSMEL